MPGIPHIQEDHNYNLQPTNDDIIKAAHFFEVFFFTTQNFRSADKVAPHLKISLGHHIRIN